jgi:predicted  nucleic acid-binding Zn-ribbon protein
MKLTYLALASFIALAFGVECHAQEFTQSEFQAALNEIHSSPKGAQLNQQLQEAKKRLADVKEEIQQVSKASSNEAAIKRRMLTEVGATQAQISQAVNDVSAKYKPQLDQLRSNESSLAAEVDKAIKALTGFRIEELRKNPKFAELANSAAAVIAEIKK